MEISTLSLFFLICIPPLESFLKTEDLREKLRRRRSRRSSSRSRRRSSSGGRRVVEVEVEVDLRTTRRQTEITKKMTEVIEDSLKTEGVVINSYNISIRKEDLFYLTGTNWLNNTIIDFYLKMIEDRSSRKNYQEAGMPKVYAMSTYFFLSLMLNGPKGMERWTKNVDIFDYDLILMPIHHQSFRGQMIDHLGPK